MTDVDLTDLTDLRERAEAWLADDPDPATRAELRAVLDGLPGTARDLADRFAGPLTFGTAGLRGAVRAGPNGMNRAVVRAAAAGLAAYLDATGAEGPVVVGYDARHGSAAFAAETANVVAGAGRAVHVLARPLPTPVLAHAVRRLRAAAGVMVTASHNPPRDNGYKVYLADGAQIVPPSDRAIEAAIRAVGPLADVPLGDVARAVDAPVGGRGFRPGDPDPDPTPPGPAIGHVVGPAVLDEYAHREYTYPASVLAGDGPRDLVVAYTPLHGVGLVPFQEVLLMAGFALPRVVPEQAAPDPAFPTVAFPNPEEPGAVDLLLARAAAVGADLAIAHDPDADRCAVAVPDRDGWRLLHGDELGVLLADDLIARGRTGTYATTIVSSSMLRALTAARGVPYAETLTGFKWIVRAADADGQPPLAYGYEEALGYAVAPDLVRDKDGISAALLVVARAASLKADGRTLVDRLDELAAELGVHLTAPLSVRVDDLARIGAITARLRADLPATLLGGPVTEVRDLLPETDAVVLRAAGARVVVRPSGTEPKLKAYLEVVEAPDPNVPAARRRASARLDALRAEVAALLGMPAG